jgi:ferritin-like metal-binding protein YciE
MAKKQKMLDDLFHETLKDIYYAEKKILTALPKMAKAAHSEELQAAFEKHEGETEGQVERLERVSSSVGSCEHRRCMLSDRFLLTTASYQLAVPLTPRSAGAQRQLMISTESNKVRC